VIVEATCKLYALPERDETLLAAFSSLGQGAAAMAQIMGTQLLPSQILLLNSPAAGAIAPQVISPIGGMVMLLLNYEGMDEAVERQLADTSRICQGQGAMTLNRCAGEVQAEIRRRLATFYPGVGPTIALAPHLLAKLGTVPSRIPAVMEAMAQLLGSLAPHTLLAGDGGVGWIKLYIPGSVLEADGIDDPLLRTLRELPRLVAAENGYAVVESAPLHVKERLDVWGPPPKSLPLLKALKSKFDPEGILSPGRFVGGL
jgi:glycolate oxidase FAD binding subunit